MTKFFSILVSAIALTGCGMSIKQEVQLRLSEASASPEYVRLLNFSRERGRAVCNPRYRSQFCDDVGVVFPTQEEEIVFEKLGKELCSSLVRKNDPEFMQYCIWGFSKQMALALTNEEGLAAEAKAEILLKQY